MKVQKSDLLGELKQENIRCEKYTSYMYQVLQFTVLAVIALAVCDFSRDVTDEGFKIIFLLVLPICFYVFGIMYVFNAYALAQCGVRESMIHTALFDRRDQSNEKDLVDIDENDFNLLKKYVVADRWVSIISYGVPLGFYFVLPALSICVGYQINHSSTELPIFIINVFSISSLIVYYILMLIIIYKISQSFFNINKTKSNKESCSMDSENV